MDPFRIRPATRSDGAFLADMVVEAANWQLDDAPPRHTVIGTDPYRRYLAGWMRPGDAGVVAVDAQGEAIGAAWYRVLPRSEPGFGYVGVGIPELIIGVRAIWRAQGTGRALLRTLCDAATAAGHPRISLSVQRGNHAALLYRSEGFAVERSEGRRDIMVRRLG